MIKKALKNLVYKLNLRIEGKPFGKPNPIHKWLEDEKFNFIYEAMRSNTIVDIRRCYMLYQLAKQNSTLEGDCAEVGVYKGGTGMLLSRVFENCDKTINLFDTFGGMPVTDKEKDWHQAGDFDDTDISKIREYFRDRQNVKIHPGLFPDTAGPVADKKFCFAHIDVDIYKSVMDCCNFFYPRMVKGGIMIFDDYGYLTCPGAKMAVDEYFSDKKEFPCYLLTGQCLVIKI